MSSILLVAVMCLLPNAVQPRPLQGLGTGTRGTGLPAFRPEQYRSHDQNEDVGVAALGGLQEDEDDGLTGQAEVQVLPSIFVSESVASLSEGSPNHRQKSEASVEQPLRLSEAEELAGAMLSGLQRDTNVGAELASPSAQNARAQEEQFQSPALSTSVSESSALLRQEPESDASAVIELWRQEEPLKQLSAAEELAGAMLSGLQRDKPTALQAPESLNSAEAQPNSPMLVPKSVISSSQANAEDVQQGRSALTKAARRTPEPEDAPSLFLAGLQEDVDANLEADPEQEAHNTMEEVQVLPSIFVSKAAVSLADASVETEDDPTNRETEGDGPADDRMWVLGAVSVSRKVLEPLREKTRDTK